MSLGHLFTEMYDATKRWPSDKFKCDLPKSTLSLNYEVFRILDAWHP